MGLLISTYNWTDALKLVFKSITEQTILPDEIILADDGSHPDNRDTILAMIGHFPLPVRYTWQEDRGFRKSLIINKAMQKSTADYIIQIDGDILLHPCFIEDHIREATKNFFVQGARALVVPETTQQLLQHQQLPRFIFSSAGISHRFNAIRIPVLSALLRGDGSQSTNIKACNLAFWREDFIRINGYNNQFEGWGDEDAEFAARLINAGVSKKRVKLAAICYHLHHELNSKHNANRNQDLYRSTISRNLIICENGYHQVPMHPAPVAAPASIIQRGQPAFPVAS